MISIGQTPPQVRTSRSWAPRQYRPKVTIFVKKKKIKRRSAGSKRCLRSLFFLSAGLESKGKLRGKAKAQKKKEEKEKKSSVKTPGDELKDSLADNDDSSSTTTETSNPDVETNIKEVKEETLKSLPHTKEVAASTWSNMKVAKSASGNGRLWWFLFTWNERKQCGSCDCLRQKAVVASENTSLSLSTMKVWNVMWCLLQEPAKKKGRTASSEKVKEESSNFPVKPKPKKQVSTKKDSQPEKSRSVLLTRHRPSSFGLSLFPDLFIFLFYWSQFPRAAIRHTLGKQTTQELYIQSSLPSGQHPKGETRAETETWVIPEGPLGSLPRCQIALWHVWSHSRRKAWRWPPLTLSQAVVQQLSARAGPQQWIWRGKRVCLSRVGHATF